MKNNVNPSNVSEVGVTYNVVEPEAPRENVMETFIGDDYGHVLSTMINLGIRTDKSKNINSFGVFEDGIDEGNKNLNHDVPSPNGKTSP